MSLSAWEQQALDSIKDGLAGSDPQLAAMLATFAQLTSAEKMPVQEMILAGTRRTPRWTPRKRPRRKQRYRCQASTSGRWCPVSGRLRLQWGVLLLWLAITAAMITIAVTMSQSGNQGTCTGSWPTLCSHAAPG
jgi:Protein of unknown function (DUF3040)